MKYTDTTLDELVEMITTEPAYKLDVSLLRRALETLDADEIRSLFVELYQLQATGRGLYMGDEIVCMIVERATERQDVDTYQLLSTMLNLLVEMPISICTGVVTKELSRIGDHEVVSLFRKILNSDKQYAREDAALGIVVTQYTEAVQALEDESELVRYMAVDQLDASETVLALNDRSEMVRHAAAEKLEKEENASGLIKALRDESASVRRIAAWYMGRKQVKEAVQPLIELVQVEDDVEALRAAIWSLGVLRDPQAMPFIDKLTRHSDPIIAATAQDSLSRLAGEP